MDDGVKVALVALAQTSGMNYEEAWTLVEQVAASEPALNARGAADAVGAASLKTAWNR